MVVIIFVGCFCFCRINPNAPHSRDRKKKDKNEANDVKVENDHALKLYRFLFENDEILTK